MIRGFVFLQAIVAIAAATACPKTQTGSAVFNGIVGAQASLMGLWVGLGTSYSLVRLITALVGVTWLGLAMHLRPNFNGWELVLLALRIAFVGGVFLGVRRCTGYVLGALTDAEEGLPLQFQIRHLLSLTFVVALVMGITQLTEDTQVGMYVYVFLVGAGFASIPLVACWAVFGRGHLKWRMFGFTIVVLLIVSALSFTAYSQTGSRTTALQWFLWSTIEAAFLALCLWSLQQLGYRIARRATPNGSAAMHGSSAS